MDAGAAGFDRGGNLAQPRGGGPAAVEADKRVVRAACESRPVAELLQRSATGRNPRLPSEPTQLVSARCAAARFAADCHWLRPLGSTKAPSVLSAGVGPLCP